MKLYGYTPLDSSIITSTIWLKDNDVLRVWVFMLSQKDKNGFVEGSIPGIASICKMSIQDMERCLKELEAPDPYSRDKEHEGRRIQPFSHTGRSGWVVLNAYKYRDKWSDEGRKQSKARWMREKRERDRAASSGEIPASVIERNPLAVKIEDARAE